MGVPHDGTREGEDKFKRLLLRFERIQQRHYGMKLMAYTLINLICYGIRCTLRARGAPSAAIMDSQSVKTTEESRCITGYDGGKQVRSIYRCL
jgi:hypothetical protein